MSSDTRPTLGPPQPRSSEGNGSALRRGSATLRLDGIAIDDCTAVSICATLLNRYTGQPAITIGVHADGSPTSFVADFTDDPSLRTLANRLAPANDRAAVGSSRRFVGSAEEYDVVLSVEHDAGGSTVTLQLALDGLDAGAPVRMLGNFDVLVRDALRRPDTALRDLDILTADERAMMLVDWNATRAPFADVPYHELFEVQAAQEPTRQAAVAADETITYGELNARANRLAHELIARGVGPDVLVGVALERGISMLVAVFAIAKAGGAYIPLDPSNPQQRQALILEDADLALLLTQSSLAAGFASLHERALLLDRLDVSSRSDENPGRRAAAENTAYIIYTSGSTGRPKGVVIEHRSVAAFLGWVRRAFDDRELAGVLFATSLAFDVSVFEIFGPLSFGGRLIVVDNILGLHDCAAKNEVALIAATASGFAALLRAGTLPASVTTAMQAGERLHGATAAALYQQPGIRRVLNMCGGTEDTVYSVIYEVPAGEHENPPIGRPFDNHEVYLLDERMRPVPIGAPGEIYYAGLGVAREYLKRPDLNQVRFVPNPVTTSPYGRLYRSGDIARYRADGNIEYLHRADTQIKLRGFRVELSEIEQVFMAHPSVAEAVVVAVLGERDDDTRLAVYLVAGGAAPSFEELHTFAAQRLPSYMIPSAFLTLDALPQDANGKLDRKALPPPRFGRRDGDPEVVAPTTPLQVELVELWREFLGLDAVGIEDDFFQLGGHSLMAARIVARVRDRHPALTLRAFIEDRTIAALSHRERAAPAAKPSNGATRAVQPVQRDAAAGDDRQLSYAQSDIWTRSRACADPAAFNVPMGWVLAGTLDRAALAQALDALAARHQQLRGRVVLHGTEPRIRFTDAIRLPLRQEISAGGSDALDAAVGEEVRRPFDLEAGPLVRAALFESKGSAPLLVLTVHELVADAFTAPVIAEDLAALYTAEHTDRDVIPPALDYAFAEYAIAEREGADSGLYDADVAYWAAHLRDARRTDLLADTRHRDGELTSMAGRLTRTLSGAEFERLRAFVHAHDTTVYAALVAAFAAFAAQTTGESEVVIGAPLAARHYPELARLVGNIASLRPLRLDAPRTLTFAGLTARAGAIVAAALDHQVTPFAVLRDRLAAQIPHVDDLLLTLGFRKVDAAPVLRSDGVTFEPRAIAAGAAPFDLLLDVTEHVNGLEYAFAFRAGGLSEARAAALFDAFSRVLSAAVAQPDVRLDDLIAPARAASAPAAQSRATQPAAVRDYPLSYAQEQLWFLDGVLSDGAVYNVPMAWRLHGTLDLAALQGALDGLIERHEQLRALFTLRDGRPVQRIAAPAALPLRRERIADEQALQAAMTREARTRFDLEKGPLARATLFEQPEADPVLLLTLHHIVSDGWSVTVIVDDLAALYAAALRGTAPHLPPLPMQYTDYAVDERANEARGAFEADFAYWAARLTGLNKLDLIGDRRASHARSAAGGHVTQRIRGEALDALRTFTRTSKTTMYAALLAAFSAFLAQQSGESDLAIGSPVFGRRDPDLEPVVGYFISMLTMRVDVGGDPTFSALATRTQEIAFDAFEHQTAPFTLLVERIAPHRDEMNSPLFSVAFVKQASVPRVGAGELSFELVPVATNLAKFDLLLEVTEETDELICTFSYSHDKFSDDFAQSLLATFCRLVALAAAAPDVPLGSLPLVTPEREATLAAAPPALLDGRPDIPVHARFAEHARRAPEALAVIDGAQHYTYARLDAAADALAHRLRAGGVAPGNFVGICMERSANVVGAILAVLRCGATYVPIDPQYPAERIAFIAADASVSVFVTDRASTALLPPGVACVVADDETGQTTGVAPPDLPPVPVGAPDDAAYVIYTSGSTGTPKGVVVTHRNVARLFDGARQLFDFGPADVWALFHSYAFDFSVWEMWGALSFGGALVVVRPEVSRSPAEFRRLVAERGVTVLNQTPSAFYEFSAADAADPTALQLRYVIFGGEALDVRQLEPWFARHGETAPQLVNMYGITETTVHVTFRALKAADAATPLGPIGDPLPDLRVLLLDEHENFVADGFPGEIYVAGDGVARGYLGRDELTAERFPDRRGGRVYRSGDLARRRLDGGYEYIGRADFQVKIRGFRVELGEIESALTAQPAVERAIVIAERDASGETRLAAFVVARDGASLDDLRTNLATTLPQYMIPATIVPLPAIPLTTNGKIDRRALAALPRTDIAPLAPDTPMTPLQARVAGIFCEFLKLDRIGLDESFFMRGGHSLLAARLAAHVEAEIPAATAHLRDDDGKSRLLRLFYISPTVRALAALLEGDTVLDGSLPLVCMQEGDPNRPAVFWLHGMFNGDGLYAWDLVKALPKDVSFYVLHPHGYDGRPFAPDMMLLATEQLGWIRSVRPHGPYHLGGFCNGALIAFEIAGRLRREGEDVLSLTLVSIPEVTRIGPRLLNASQRIADALRLNADQRSRLYLYLRSYTSRVMNFVRADSGERRSLIEDGFQKVWRKVAPLVGLPATKSLAVEGDFNNPYFKNNHYVRAISEYQPSHYPGTVDLVWGREIHAGLYDPTNGWSASADRANVHVLDGGHLTLAAENGDQIGELLRGLVDGRPGNEPR